MKSNCGHCGREKAEEEGWCDRCGMSFGGPSSLYEQTQHLSPRGRILASRRWRDREGPRRSLAQAVVDGCVAAAISAYDRALRMQLGRRSRPKGPINDGARNSATAQFAWRV